MGSGLRELLRVRQKSFHIPFSPTQLETGAAEGISGMIMVITVIHFYLLLIMGGGSDGKESVCNAGDSGLIPGLERSSGERNGNPLQYVCLESPVDRLQSTGSQRVGHD